jgi:hypothetical protein
MNARVLLSVALSMSAACTSGEKHSCDWCCTTDNFFGLPVDMLEADDRIVFSVGGEPFTEYRYANEPKPILFPLYAPGGGAVTRSWPIVEVPGEERDHPHHQSLWFAHGAVNGHDFWTGRDGARIVHDAFLGVDERGASVRSRNLWRAGDVVVLTEERTMRFAASATERTIDFELALVATHGAVHFGDTKEGTFALRLVPTLQLSGEHALGHALNSEGVRDAEVWGKRARWVAYSGPLDPARADSEVCVALLDHPSNPRHPTWWHARDYGLFAANPFGVHDFEGAPADTGDLELAAGERLVLRYRLLVRTGPADGPALERAWAYFAAQAER